MKTVRKLHGLINMLILVMATLLGTIVGHVTGQVRIGFLMGMASGLIGITAFYYYLGLRSVKVTK